MSNLLEFEHAVNQPSVTMICIIHIPRVGSMHHKAQALLEAHLQFIAQQLQDPQFIRAEVLGFFSWLKQQPLDTLWSETQIQALLQQQILNTPSSAALIQIIERHIVQALTHPSNQHTYIEDVIPVETVDQMAQYIASKAVHRQALIQALVHNPSYTQLISELLQQSIKDYLQHSVSNHKIPGVGSILKMGKSVLEIATDQALDETLNKYLQKNIHKISSISEKILNHQLQQDKLYHLQAQLWHRIKKIPLAQLRQYIVVEDLPQTLDMGQQIWQHLRQTPYLQQQLADAVHSSFSLPQRPSFAELLTAINIDDQLLENELSSLLLPIIQQSLQQGYLFTRIKLQLSEFYGSEQVSTILNRP